MLDNIIVLDAETSLHNDEVGKFEASPHSLKNWIVWLGVMEICSKTMQPKGEVRRRKMATRNDYSVRAPTPNTLIVGHNIGFDLLYLCNSSNKYHNEWRRWINSPDAMIWDTQIAEYRLKGQSIISPSLDRVCEARGWATKPGRLKEYWAQGISTEDIPDDEVDPYLQHDVATTGQLFCVQLMEAQNKDMLSMLRYEMQSRLTTIVMEHNGMYFDDDAAIDYRDTELVPQLASVLRDGTARGMALFKLPQEAVKLNSSTFMNSILHGGTVKWKERHPVLDDDGEPVRFKTGKRKGEVKEKWHDMSQEVMGVSPIKGTKADEEMFNKVIGHPRTKTDVVEFLTVVLRHRDLAKQHGTYFTGYAELTWPDGMIHGNLNHCIVATGRLSSTSPNLQNAGHSPIRQHFKSRYAQGRLMEVDLSQIEVAVQAVLSQDRHMINDIIRGIDFHSKRAAFAHGVDYADVVSAVNDKSHGMHDHWKRQRKSAKTVSFQKAYGAGVKKIADTTGLSHQEVKAFMNAEDINYPNVPKTQQAWIEEVQASTQIRDGRTCGTLYSPINVEYRFFQDDFNGHLSYKPTTIKNYPIQGFSADILKMIMAGLRAVITDFNRTFADGSDQVLIVNTVHDSVIFDLPSWVSERALATALVKHFVETPERVLKDSFNYDLNVPLSADADVGDDWYNMKGVETL